MTTPLSSEHIDASNRQRRIIVNFDVISGDRTFGGRDPDELVAWKFNYIDDAQTQIDSVWWCWGEGHQSPWPSQTMPLYDDPGYRKWADADINIAQVFFEASRQRGIESFYNYRINGSDNDLGPVAPIPMKDAHPDWLIRLWNKNGYWNFAHPGVRQYKLAILTEIANQFDCDGLAIDFARLCPVLTPGQAWVQREHLTQFMRDVRSMTQQVAKTRGRPFLIGARIPENIMGCHFDGIDIENWCRDGLVDVLALGVRSLNVDVPAFRHAIDAEQVKLYPCIDDHHASDGYKIPPIEIYRGVAARWHRQGADGIQVFNFNHAPGAPFPEDRTEMHLCACREIGDPRTLLNKDKTFIVERRGGGHGRTVLPDPEDWSTPRAMYFNTNMFASLPADVEGHGRFDTLLTIHVAADLVAAGDRLAGVALRLLLSDPSAEGLSDGERLSAAAITFPGHKNALSTAPPPADIVKRIEVRVNNVLLDQPNVHEGWLLFTCARAQFAVGENLVGVGVKPREVEAHQTVIEKLEVDVRYRSA